MNVGVGTGPCLGPGGDGGGRRRGDGKGGGHFRAAREQRIGGGRGPGGLLMLLPAALKKRGEIKSGYDARRLRLWGDQAQTEGTGRGGRARSGWMALASASPSQTGCFFPFSFPFLKVTNWEFRRRILPDFFLSFFFSLLFLFFALPTNP